MLGKDVESIVRDLVETAVKECREKEMLKVDQRALDAAEERVLDALLPPARSTDSTQEKTRQPDKYFGKNYAKELSMKKKLK